MRLYIVIIIIRVLHFHLLSTFIHTYRDLAQIDRRLVFGLWPSQNASAVDT
jgi:hypothetical protein